MIQDYDLLSLVHLFSQFMVLYPLPLLQRNPVVEADLTTPTKHFLNMSLACEPIFLFEFMLLRSVAGSFSC